MYQSDQQKTSYICAMCGHKEKSGIVIHSGFICDECEKEIVHTEVEDERYPYFVKRMKEIWLKNA